MFPGKEIPFGYGPLEAIFCQERSLLSVNLYASFSLQDRPFHRLWLGTQPSGHLQLDCKTNALWP